jgi:23S rRNA (pseudouridine1915-N3)-methyltransferase
MRVAILSVGRVKGPLAQPIAEYESRIAHYFSFVAHEIKEESASGGRSPHQVVEEEGNRLLARLPERYELVALHRTGRQWSSEELASYLEALGNRSLPGAAFVIGGAFGLSEQVLKRSAHLLSLSAMTLPHELARLVCTEQLYRAGTILRGEPYHKAPLAGLDDPGQTPRSQRRGSR